MALSAALIPDKQVAAQSRDVAAPVDSAESSKSTGTPRTLSLHDGKFTIDLSRYPVSGSASAKHVVAIISDYTCPHCRETEKTLSAALYGFNPEDVAFVHLPGTREKKDGPALHKIMLSLWQEHPAIYRRLSAQLIHEELPAEPEKVRAAAATALGGAAVLDALVEKHHAWAEEEIAKASQLMITNADSPARAVLPQVMLGPKLITGSIINPADLQDLIQEQFGVAAVRRAYSLKQLLPDPADPCEPSWRKSCGRIVISMIAAGEMTGTSSYYPKDKTVPLDKHAGDASGHLLQFTASPAAKLPSAHIVLTSDPEVKAWVKKLPFGSHISLAGVVDASLPAFKRMVSPEDADSPLNRAITFFESNPDCKKLMKGIGSVTPYLKVDLIVDGELTEAHGSTSENPKYGVAVFKDEGTVGTFDRWLDDGVVLGEKEISTLLDRLSGSLVHVFINTCKAALIGKIFESAIDQSRSCGCVLNVADEKQDDYSGGLIRPSFNYAMPNEGREYEKIRLSKVFGVWANANINLVTFSRSLLNKHELLIMQPIAPDARDAITFRNLTEYHRNPLFGFAYTSADALTNRALAMLQEHSATSSTAKQIALAEFVEETRPIQVDRWGALTGSAKGNAHLTRISRHLAEVESQLGSVVDRDAKNKLDTTVVNAELRKFDQCLRGDSRAPGFCSVFRELFAAFEKKRAESLPLTDEERLFLRYYSPFMDQANGLNFFTLWPDFIAGSRNLKDLLSCMARYD